MSEEQLEKAVWTAADFDRMDWHDARVHAITFHEVEQDAELLLDLDYIVRWIDPEPPAEYFSFLVAPATLVFENVWCLEGELGAAERTGYRSRASSGAIQRTTASGRWVSICGWSSGPKAMS
jgi:hypothetical protein